MNHAHDPRPSLAKSARTEYQRNLPHIQKDGHPLFVTFSTFQRWVLPPEVRGHVMKHCLHDNGIKLLMHGAIVMPDHVHLAFTPLEDGHGNTFGLAEIMSGIKGASSHTINRLLRRHGHVWQDESFDHVLRRDESLVEKVEYMCENPVRAGLVKTVDEYPWLWREWVEGEIEPPSVL